MSACFLCADMVSGSNFVANEKIELNEPIVQIHEEPSHRHVAHTNSIRVFDVYLPPNKLSLYHSHEKNSVMICLEGGDVTSEFPGKEVTPRPAIPSGDIYYRSYAKIPLIHRVRNIGSTIFRILDIEILKQSEIPTILHSLPVFFNLVIENERVRVSKLQLSPNQSSGEIAFLSPRLLAITKSGVISISSKEQFKVIEASPGSIDMQETGCQEIITNTGNTDIEIIIIEIK